MARQAKSLEEMINELPPDLYQEAVDFVRSLLKKKSNLRKPSEKANISAQWEIVGPRGGDQGGVERTVPKGTKLPPTPEPGQMYKSIDKTRTRGQKPKKKIKLEWRGSLRDLRNQFTSVELQHEIRDLWDQEDVSS